MKLNNLGNTGLRVAPLCFGTLTLGPLQRNLSLPQAEELLCRSYDLGVNFFDTAEVYGNYEALALLLKYAPEAVVASKSYATTYEKMRDSVERARRVLNRDYIDIFLMHELADAASLRGRRGALDYLSEAKQKGLVRAIGISTHTVAGARTGACEPELEVVHPLINQAGLGIQDGTVEQMMAALETVREFGKGIYAMKALAGGHLVDQAGAALSFVMDLPGMAAVAVGMQSLAEVRVNLRLVAGVEPDQNDLAAVGGQERSLWIEESECLGCGECVKACGFGALSLGGGKARVQSELCVRCGYCGRACPKFCLRII